MREYYLIPADCIEALRKMRANSIDSMVTDPPYGWRFMGKAWDGFEIAQKFKKREHEDKKCKHGSLAQNAGEYDLTLSGNLAFQAWTTEWAREVYRVLKPGGHILVFCGPRTYHRMASGVEDAGFEIRDQMQWLFGSGFPKSLNIGKTIKEYEGFGTALKPANEPILLARKPLSEKTVAANVLLHGTAGINIDGCRIGYASEKDAKEGRSARDTTSKGQFAALTKDDQYDRSDRSQIQGRFPANLVLSHDEECEQVGSKTIKLNGSGKCSGNTTDDKSIFGMKGNAVSYGKGDGTETVAAYNCTDTCAVKMLDEQSGDLKSGKFNQASKKAENSIYGKHEAYSNPKEYDASQGGASRFFKTFENDSRFLYCAKASKSERNLGCEGLEAKELPKDGPLEWGVHGQTGKPNKAVEPRANHHPTVKPIKLMRYLCRLVTPPNGVILDPFLGSGSTGVAALQEGFHFIGIEREGDYFKIALTRLRYLYFGDQNHG